MLKRFFVVFLGSMAAVWLSVFLLVMGALLFVVTLVGSGIENLKIDDHSILVVELKGDIAERYESPSVKDIVLEKYDDSAPTLDEIVRALDLAAKDSRIDGVYLNCKGATMGYATRQEIIKALERFKKSGKWIYAYADNYTQGDYYVAAAADRIFLNNAGSVDIHGIGTSIPFFKNALDKLGVKVQVFKVGTYKSAVEPFLLTSISEPAKEQTEVFLNSIWSDMTSFMAERRKVKVEDTKLWADTLLVTVAPDSLVSMKVVDELCYRRVIEDKMRSLTHVNKGDDLRLLTPADYLNAPDVNARRITEKDKHVALLYAVGDIVDTGNQGIVADELVPQIISLADDDKVSALVMRVNSGGGSAFASEQIWEALQYFKSTGKPFYVSMGDYAASGGYYISCGADKIFCDPATLTGSIGIFGMIPDLQGLLNNHLGVDFSNVWTTPNATFPSITSSMTVRQMNAMQRYVENGYALFTRRVAEGRGLAIDSVLKIAEGRVWDGAHALRLGLVDGHACLSEVLEKACATTHLPAGSYVAYPVSELSGLERLLLAVTSQADTDAIMHSDIIERLSVTTPTQLEQYVRLLKLLASGTQIFARMEDLTIQ